MGLIPDIFGEPVVGPGGLGDTPLPVPAVQATDGVGLVEEVDPAAYGDDHRRREREVWQGPSGRWFRLRKNHPVPTWDPTAEIHTPQREPVAAAPPKVLGYARRYADDPFDVPQFDEFTAPLPEDPAAIVERVRARDGVAPPKEAPPDLPEPPPPPKEKPTPTLVPRREPVSATPPDPSPKPKPASDPPRPPDVQGVGGETPVVPDRSSTQPAPRPDAQLPDATPLRPQPAPDPRKAFNDVMAAPFEVSKNLSGADAELERASQQFARANYPALRARYMAKNAVTDPATGDVKSVVLNTDEWRELVPGYVGTNSAAVHEAASWLNKALYAEVLADQAGKGNNKLMVLAGGGGSGKGSAVKDFFVQADYPVVLDQVSDNLKKLEVKLAEAKSAGYTPEYVFIDRPFDESADGVVTRAVKLREKGKPARTVPIDAAIHANIAARRVALELIETHPDVTPKIVENRPGPWGPRRLLVDRAEAAAHLRARIAEDEAKLATGGRDRVIAAVAAKYAAGRIPDDLMVGFLGANWRTEIARVVGVGQSSTAAPLPPGPHASLPVPPQPPTAAG